MSGVTRSQCKECENKITIGSRSGLCKSCAHKSDKHYLWKKDKAKYTAIHMWILKWWEKSGNCERCAKTGIATEWSCNDKNYDRLDRTRWEELCRSCHRKKDYTEYSRQTSRKLSKLRMKDQNLWINQPKKIKQYTKDGDEIHIWHSITEASRILGIGRPNISQCLTRRSKTAGGFGWSYA